MDVKLTGKHIDITDPIRRYAEEKTARLPKFYDRVQSVEVVVDRNDSHRYKLEMIAHVDGHEHFVATVKGEDVYGCIDQVVDKLERQLHDYKEKRRDQKRA